MEGSRCRVGEVVCCSKEKKKGDVYKGVMDVD